MSKWHVVNVYPDGIDDPRGRPSAVYVIYRDGRAVYVGQTEWSRTRLLEHFKLLKMGTESRRWRIKVRPERFFAERATLELRLIRRLQPELNQAGKRDNWTGFGVGQAVAPLVS